jgi:hypothetical protein
MPMGIQGSYNNDSSILDVVRQRNELQNQNEVQGASSPAEQIKQTIVKIMKMLNG